MLNLKLALRTLFRSPFVTIVAVVSLALGIGANTGIFSLFHQLILRSLPVQEPSRLVNLSAPGPKPGSQQCNQAGDCDVVFSYPMFRDLERVQTSFTGIAAHRLFGANLAYRGQTLSGEGLFVSGSYFPVLGTPPALGRLLGPSDDRSIGDAPVAVLSHAWWQSRFGADPNVLNDTLIVNGQSLTIVGVTARDFTGTTLGATPQVFVPITLRGILQPWFTSFDNRRNYWVYTFARLKPGVSLDQAKTAINVPYRQIVSDVEAPLQQGMSDQTMAKFKAKGDRDRGRVARAELGPRRGQDAAAASARRDRRSSSSSPAPTSPTCSSHARRDVPTRWPSACRLARAGCSSSRSCSSSRVCWQCSVVRPACSSPAGRSISSRRFFPTTRRRRCPRRSTRTCCCLREG